MSNKNCFLIDIQGDQACWSICKGERVSYDVPTPSAIVGLLRNIFWKPAIQWVVDEIHLLDSGHTLSERRNEIADFGAMVLKTVQVNTMMRKAYPGRPLHYRARVHFELTDKAGEMENEKKFEEIFLRRIRRGQYFDRPYLGLRQNPAIVTLVEDESKVEQPLNVNRDGRMLLCFDWTDPEDPHPIFFKATMRNGVIKVPEILIGNGDKK